MPNTPEYVCMHESRLTSIERDIAELQARVDGKKEDIHEINKELLRDRKQQTELLEKVTRVTVLLEEGQKQRADNNSKLEEAERKIDNLQNDLTAIQSSLNSFRNTVIVSVPIISIIVSIILHFIV